AFEILLLRHGPMVLSLCRRILHNDADAEDAYQSTFLVFVRKAASIRPRQLVGNWLYGVAYTTSLKARELRGKRQFKARKYAALKAAAVYGDACQDRMEFMYAELHALPKKYRAPIVLCDLEGQTIKDAARQLGCPANTVSTRLARGRRL